MAAAISSVADLAATMRNCVPSATIDPPSTSTRTRAWYVSAPLMPKASPFTPASTSVSSPSARTDAAMGVDMAIVAVSRPGADAAAPGSDRSQPADDDLIDGRGEHLACVADVAHAETGARDGGVEIQRAAVVGCRCASCHRDGDIAHRLIGHLARRPGDHLVHDQPFGFRERSGRDQRSHAGQRLARGGVRRVVRAAGPQRVLVQLEPFVLDAAEHHGPEPPVANRERFDPLRRGLSVPEGQRALGRFDRRLSRARSLWRGRDDRGDERAGRGENQRQDRGQRDRST